ncbi:hypothetical protein K501DRAFT_258746 [Backusella circina FSU 941]|nr:hypothetical protein K501DRAFT_258746 [Backusella circina FSU 941]
MQLTSAHLFKNTLVLGSIVLGVVGWFIAFIGSCIVGKDARVFWWVIIFELLLLGGIFFSVTKQEFHHYQFMFLVFLGVGASLLTLCVDSLVSSGSRSAQAAGAGGAILLTAQLFWIVLFGSTEESSVYQFIYTGFVPPVSQNGTHLGEITKESKIGLSSSGNSHHHYPQSATQSIASVHQSSPMMHQQQQHDSQLPQQIAYSTALHTYQANPDDPNELSFVKDEQLEILNKSGNWWQAKKSDGSIGIVPSNYFPA